MLAGIEEALRGGCNRGVKERMTAIDCVLADLFDYAGLFPPTGLDMHSAVRNYLEYSRGFHHQALGRFVVEFDEFPYLFDAAGDYVRGMRLSLIAAPDSDWSELRRLLEKGYRIEAIEIKVADCGEIERAVELIPEGPAVYFEIPWSAQSAQVLEAAAAAGASVKLRMGGVRSDSFPSSDAVANMLRNLAAHCLSFKATAGLHHPLRSRHSLTCTPDGPIATMHGFINLVCAAALVHFGGEPEEACRLLDEDGPDAWRIAPDSIGWRSHQWTANQLCTVRREFLMSVGSCSFSDPIRDLEALGWL
jgi:hypothetical protein